MSSSKRAISTGHCSCVFATEIGSGSTGCACGSHHLRCGNVQYRRNIVVDGVGEAAIRCYRWNLSLNTRTDRLPLLAQVYEFGVQVVVSVDEPQHDPSSSR